MFRRIVLLIVASLVAALSLAESSAWATEEDEEGGEGPTRVYIRPFDEMGLERNVAQALNIGRRFFESALSESGRFVFAADQEIMAVISQCTEETSGDPSQLRECRLQQARRSAVRWVFEFTMDEMDDEEYIVTLDVWNTSEGQKDHTITVDATGNLRQAARSGMEQLANELLGRLNPAYLEVTSISPSDAHLVIGSNDIGRVTAGSRREVTPGSVTIEVRAEGHEPYTETFSIEAGETHQLTVALDPMNAMLSITCNVSGATVFLNGANNGSISRANRAQTFETSADVTELVIQHEGYNNFTQALQLEPGRTTTINATLQEGTSTQVISNAVVITNPIGPVQTGSRGGDLSLSSGFSPDPATISGTALGEVSSPTGCNGYISNQPSHQITLNSSFSFLRFSLSYSAGDTVMVIDGPGGLRCDDDGDSDVGEELWPQIEGTFTPGTYRVWVGTYSSGQSYAYTLAITTQGTTYVDPSMGTSCLGDSDCGYNGECMAPGYCATGRGNETMTFTDIAYRNFYAYNDGSCIGDSDCGPHLCNNGWCTDPSQLYSIPTRSNFFYYDSSCSDSSHCGSWACSDGWCRPSDRVSSGTGSNYAYDCSEAYSTCININGYGAVTTSGTSGGPNDASTVSYDCRGWINRTPDHVMYVNSYMSWGTIAVNATDSGDTTLVVQGPNGTQCNDDSNGFNPAVSGAFPVGTYNIWVGSYSSGTFHPYTLSFQ